MKSEGLANRIVALLEGYNTVEHTEKVRRMINAHIDAARREERKRCINAVCDHCSDGVTVAEFRNGHWRHYFKSDGRWEHCAACNIRTTTDAGK